VTKPAAGSTVTIPEPDDEWHPAAGVWYSSLAESGQSAFYTSSDWATAWMVAEQISREFKPKPMRIGDETVLVEAPVTGAGMAAFLRACAVLLVTEGDRRRVAMELQKPPVASEQERAPVTTLAAWKATLNG
jgi:hypothetical protein